MSTTQQTIDLSLALTASRPTTRPAGMVAQVASILRAMRNRWSATSLSDLDDRQLADIGLTREEVMAILRSTRLIDDPTAQLARSARKHSLLSLVPRHSQ